MELCRWMRWKTFYGQLWRTRAELATIFANNDVPYQCLKTCQAWGPDDDVASPECCSSQRVCFEPSPKLPRAVT